MDGSDGMGLNPTEEMVEIGMGLSPQIQKIDI